MVGAAWLVQHTFVLLLASPQPDETNGFTYIACYKPALTLCSLQSDIERSQRKNRDPRKTLADLDVPLPVTKHGLHIVGRLDRDSEGLLLLTDDGHFTASVLSEKCHKEYWALINCGLPSTESMEKMRGGNLNIRGAITRPPLVLNILETKKRESLALPPPVPGMDRGTNWLEVHLNEGKNRQVRKITGCAGHKTVRLCRVAIGSFRLQDHEDLLQPGTWKYISRESVESVEL
ncbi:MAG: hypothetical protein SGBAC_008484 [Bacillariaceae sp.]